MVDIETLGDGSIAPIIQIGAVMFDESGPIADTRFLANVTFKSALASGVPTAGSLEFWIRQSMPARAGLFATPDPVPLAEALSHLSTWWSEKKPKQMWSHATFDAVILDNAYQAFGRMPPWSRRKVMDLRTLAALVPIDRIERLGTHHNALDDAIHQARVAGAALTKLSATFALNRGAV